MQLSILTQTVRNASSQIATGASTAAQTAVQTASQWGSRAVQALSGYTTILAAYARAAASYASTFFSNASRTAVAFCSTQPYFAAGVGIGSAAAIAFLAVRHYRRTQA